MTSTNHKAWIDNEYTLWAEALNSSTVNNFREHPQVKRMLGEIDGEPYYSGEVWRAIILNKDVLVKIDNIGYPETKVYFSGAQIRMVYWALKVLEKNPKAICEIGGGVGEFYAILRALGYTGSYFIYDLPAVKEFQLKFLKEVERLTGLYCELSEGLKSFCVSFYALGEFDDELKNEYIENVVNACMHGLIVFNPHSGASSEINIDHPLTLVPQSDGTTLITW